MVKNSPANAEDIRDMGLISRSGRSPGEGYGNPLQYSCLENPMDSGAWRATVHRITNSWTRLKQLRTHAGIMNTGVLISLSDSDFSYFSWLTRSQIAGSYGSSGSYGSYGSSIFYFFEEPQHCFLQSLLHLVFSPTVCEGANFILAKTCHLFFLE